MNIDINTYSEYTQEDELNSENIEDVDMYENTEELEQYDEEDEDDVPIGLSFWNSKYVEEVYQDPHDENEVELDDDKIEEDDIINNVDDEYYKNIESNYVESINNFYDENIADKSNEVESYDNPTEDEISEMEMDIIRKSLLGDEDM